jgi:anti-sigma factor RsiW
MFEYLDGELSPAQCLALERHLASCDCCEEMAESLRRVMDTCRAASGHGLPRDVQRRARLRIKRLLDEMT